MFQHLCSNNVCRDFFEPHFQEQCRGFCGFERGQCGFFGSVGGSVVSSEDNVGVEGAVSGGRRKRRAISGRRMTKRRGCKPRQANLFSIIFWGY